MKRRRLRAGFIALALLVPGMVAVHQFVRPPRVVATPGTIGRIQPGMTLAAVETILGAPATNSAKARVWTTDVGDVSIVFDSQDRVVYTVYTVQPRPLAARLRERLGF